MNRKNLILGAMVISITTTAITNLQQNGRRAPAARIVIGGYVVTVVLLAGSEAYPELAESFALLIMLATLFGPNGQGLIDVVTKFTSNGASIRTAKGPDLSAHGTGRNRGNGVPYSDTGVNGVPASTGNNRGN